MRTPLALLGLAVAMGLGCRPAAVTDRPVPVAESDEDLIQLYIPSRVGYYHLIGGRRYEDPALGVSARYAGPDSTTVDVYVYPGPDFGADCARACADSLFLEETAGFVLGFDEMIAEGFVDSIAVQGRENLVRPEGALWEIGQRLDLRVVRDGSVQRSEYHLYYLRGLRFKLRATYPADSSRLAHVARFTTEALDAFAKEPVEFPEPTRENILRLIEGTWDWSTSPLLCEARTHTITVDADGEHFTIVSPREAPDTALVTRYRILAVGPGTLTDEPFTVRGAILGETRTTVVEKPVEWHLVLFSPEAYAWHRTDWQEDGRTPPIHRCSWPE